jgi:methylmalonyl-CoA mutase N-terminal domain/subunit
MKERFYAQDPKSLMLRFHTQTAGSTLTAQEPHNNAVRVALQALAAVLGGTQSLHTNSFDEALSLPTEDAVRLALRTQQIIAFESGIPHAIDPCGGSYCIEVLTNDLEKKINDYLKEIEEMGGALSAVENGYFQKEIHHSAYEYQKAVETKEIRVVGVNTFVGENVDKHYSVLSVKPNIRAGQLKKLRQVKKKRNNANLVRALDNLTNAARTDRNLMEPILACVKQYATVGEISDALREVYGEYREKNIL